MCHQSLQIHIRYAGRHCQQFSVIFVPLSVVWVATRVAGCLLRNKREWVYSCYDKLASSLVYDNEKMLKTGFKPRHDLETIFPRGNVVSNLE